MWFKQLQLFKLDNLPSFASVDLFNERLIPLLFTSCLPSMPQSIGWVSPIKEDDDGALVRVINGYAMLCLQVEEKILPATVIRQELSEAIKQIETSGDRKLRSKEKLTLKDEITMTLLPRAFTKRTRVYAYIDPQNNWLVLGTANLKKTDQFLSLFKKSLNDEIHYFDIKKLASTMTNWLKNQNYSSSFAIEKACVLQDPNQETRVIRCKHQDLFAPAIQTLIKDGCDAIQLALSWQDRVNFVLASDFSLSNIQFQDEITDQIKELEPETAEQQFDADFLIMTATLSSLLKDLMELVNITGAGKILSIAKTG